MHVAGCCGAHSRTSSQSGGGRSGKAPWAEGPGPPPPHPQPSDDEGIESHGLLPVLNCSVTAVQNQTFAGAHTRTCVNAAARGPRARLPRPAPRAVRGHRQPAAPPGGKMMRLRGYRSIRRFWAFPSTSCSGIQRFWPSRRLTSPLPSSPSSAIPNVWLIQSLGLML